MIVLEDLNRRGRGRISFELDILGPHVFLVEQSPGVLRCVRMTSKGNQYSCQCDVM